MSTANLQYEMVEDRNHPGDYRVEAIDHDGDGEVFVTIFSGPDAQIRAEEYADWKNSSQQPLRKAS
jgi:hypothetical protein